MRKPSLALGALFGALTSLPLMALFYLGQTLAGLPFIPFDLFDWLARVLPGPVVTLGIDSMVEAIRFLNVGAVSETAKTAEQLMALILFVALITVTGLIVAFIQRGPSRSNVQVGAAAGLGLLFLFVVVWAWLGPGSSPLLTLVWLGALTIGWGGILGRLIGATAAEPVTGEAAAEETTEVDAGRRDLLLKVAGGSIGLALGGWGLGRVLAESAADTAAEAGASQPLAEAAPTRPQPTAAPTAGANVTATPTPNLEDRIEPAPGTRPEVTPTEDFYRIDINTRPPVIDGDAWELEVGGLFQQPRNLTLEDLMAYPAVTQAITLSCISNRIAGDLISTGYWTGLRLRDLVADLQLEPEAGALFLEAEDGFFETVTAEDMMDERTLLVYGMNGETLPVEHGYPLRIYIPNRYGMKQPKWIVRMEAIEAWRPGYWVERGWSREARPHIVSVIDTIAEDAAENGAVPVGGIAWAGDRGIQKVELQVDDGPWEEAELRKPPLSTLTWVQWRYNWPAEPGSHTLTVRATDGTGTLQTAEETGVRPDGATGYHSRNVSI
ncbi:MAG: molybdopterin-dependent oxidoreductase [Candidatus Promineifilaceae bacterium]|nr:molybdopterin-dependent oxidoreductase [Candidatus Promineifilaceae bacterium]